MANGDIQAQLGDSYLAQFNLSLGVSATQKLQQFPFLQELGYNGQLSYMKKDFHGLKDFYTQLAKYSQSHPILLRAWALIIATALGNATIGKLLFNAPGLGSVGKLFQGANNFGQVFSLSPQDLQDPAVIANKIASVANLTVTVT
jgi:hypothetical protein